MPDRTNTAFGRVVKGAWNENRGLKFVSLLAAVVLFSFVHGAEDALRSVYVDIVPLLPESSSERMLMSDLPERVKVTLRGKRTILNSFVRKALPPVQIDLRGADVRNYYFDGDSFSLPRGVTLVQVSPPSLRLTWAPRKSKSVAVRVELTGRYQGGGADSAQTRRVKPEYVTIQGAEPVLASIDAVRTRPIDTTALTPGTHELKVDLEPLPHYADYVGAPTVAVTLDLRLKKEMRDFRDLPVAVVGPFARVSSRPTHVKVRLTGPATALNALRPEDVIPYVELPDAAAGSRLLTVGVRGLPEGVSVAEVVPAEIFVTFAGRQ